MKCLHMLFGAIVLLTAGTAAVAAADAPPADSVYAIPALQLRDQDGRTFVFSSLRGTPRLVGMFYGSCTMVCPLEIEYLKRLEKDVVAAGGAPVPVLLVSFDPANDTVEALRKVAAEHKVQSPLFLLTRREQGDEGMLAGVLGIAYRKLPQGGFSHNVVVALLDADGRILDRFDASGPAGPAFIKAVAALPH